LTTSNKNFRVKNGLEVLGVSATVDGNEVLTEASSLDALANVDTTGVVDGNTIIFNEATSTFIAGAISGGAAFEISDTAPENPEHGDVWYNSANGGLFIRYNDGFGSYEFEEDSSAFYTDDAGRGYTLRLDLSWTRNESQNSYTVYYEYRLFAGTSSFFGFAFNGLLQINNSTVWTPSGTYAVSANSSTLLTSGNIGISYPEFPILDIPLAVTALFSAQTPQSFLPLPSTIAASDITLVNVLEPSSEQWVQVGLTGPQGAQGEQGIQGESGEDGKPGLVVQSEPPEDTSVLWVDPDEDGVGVPLGGTEGQILVKVDDTDLNTTWADNSAESSFYLVRNNTGSTILKGTLVSATGAEPSGRVDVGPFETTGLQDSEIRVMGVATSNIANGTNGTVISFGTLRAIDTRGTVLSAIAVGDETWAEGDILYAHPTVAGKLTNVRPQHDLAVAFITVRHQSAGQIAVRIVPSNSHLEWLHDVEIDTPAAGNLVVRNSENTLWENATPAEAGLSEVGHDHNDLYYEKYETDNAISTAISNVVDTAPEVLDTLNELSSALNDDPNFATTVADALAALVPSGTINQTARATAPTGYLLCDGSAISRSTYASLFDAIGTAYGVGDGSTTFNIPNLQGRVPVGRDSSQSEFDVLGEVGGAKTHTLTEAQMPAHTHSWSAQSAGDVNDFLGGSAASFGISASYNASTNYGSFLSTTGGNQAHNNLQPYVVLNYMIKI
jgi:microcystin-dependent protein